MGVVAVVVLHQVPAAEALVTSVGGMVVLMDAFPPANVFSRAPNDTASPRVGEILQIGVFNEKVGSIGIKKRKESKFDCLTLQLYIISYDPPLPFNSFVRDFLK